MTEIASDTYMTVLYQLGRKWKKRTDFWRYFDIWGESWGACARQGDKCVHTLPDGGENALSGLQTQTRRRDVQPGDKCVHTLPDGGENALSGL